MADEVVRGLVSLAPPMATRDPLRLAAVDSVSGVPETDIQTGQFNSERGEVALSMSESRDTEKHAVLLPST